MKFVFVSHGISPKANIEIQKLVGKQSSDTKILFITTAANTYPPDISWLVESRQELANYSYQLTEYDIEAAFKEKQDIKKIVNQHDIVLISGGNTFYFLYWAQKVGLKKILSEYLNNGGIYMGESAGVVCQIKDLEPIKWADNPDKSPEPISEGMQLTDLIIIPHWDHPRFKEINVKIRDYYQSRGLVTYELRNGEIMLVNVTVTKII